MLTREIINDILSQYSKEELTNILREELEAVGISYNEGQGKSYYPLDLYPEEYVQDQKDLQGIVSTRMQNRAKKDIGF